MDGVGTPIIGRPRPLPGHDTPNPANNTYTLNYEEPRKIVFEYHLLSPSSLTLGAVGWEPASRHSHPTPPHRFLNTESKAAAGRSYVCARVYASASGAPVMRYIPASSHSTEIGLFRVECG